uniref:Vacuolar protein sorting-associated protein 18 homolog n=1 Tax=Phlebotomus papatasi TaxID=29031 RepID=A0A1B0DRJ0_PHLPP
MTSMFDQYNKTLKRDETSSKSSSVVTPTSSGYISVRMSQEAPIFSKLKMNISMPHVINHLAVSNGWLMLVMANNVVFRMQLVDINRSDEVPLEKYMAGQEIARVFLDPLGAHLLIALVPKSTQFVPELLYLHRSQSKPKRIDKFRDHEITCVAFNYENDSETSTGAILLGTSRGLIFEVELAVESDKVVNNNWKQVFDIGRNENIPITGIEYFRVPSTNEYIVLASSLDRFYKFQETIKSDDRQPLQSIFNSYLNVPEDIQDFYEIKNVAKGKTTKLRVCYDYKSHFPRSFGWITEPCIFYGEMDPKSDNPARIVHNKRIPFPENEKNSPVAFALTDFHAILVYPDHLTAISLLNYQTVYEEFISENFGPLMNAETIAAAMMQGKRLDPVKLLPTLIVIESDVHVAEIIRYLEFCIHSMGCTETAIHNFIIKLYAQHRGEKLMIFLETQGKDVTLIHYDVHYALRICRQHDIPEACVFLQCLLEMWYQAVELALTVNTKLAQQTASMVQDRDLKRKLWLRIAEHEIRGKEDVKEALELLGECDLLRIEDLLPFFSDFERIDHFKEAICDALKEYNLKIQEQRRDMDESAKSAEKVRADLQSFRNRSVTISATDQCSICTACLLVRPFFVFPCGHKFHEDCLEKHLMPLLTTEVSQRLSGLKVRLNMLGGSHTNQEGDAQNAREALKEEIQTIVASDCVFCGELTIETIDKPFISDWDRVKNDWN